MCVGSNKNLGVTTRGKKRILHSWILMDPHRSWRSLQDLLPPPPPLCYNVIHLCWIFLLFVSIDRIVDVCARFTYIFRFFFSSQIFFKRWHVQVFFFLFVFPSLRLNFLRVNAKKIEHQPTMTLLYWKDRYH